MRSDLRRERRKALASAAREVERAVQPVDRQAARADDLGQTPLGHAPGDVHLKEAVLRVQIAERAHGIVEVVGENMRHTMLIADHANIGFQAVQLHLAIEFRQALAPPEIAAARRNERNCNEECENAK